MMYNAGVCVRCDAGVCSMRNVDVYVWCRRARVKSYEGVCVMRKAGICVMRKAGIFVMRKAGMCVVRVAGVSVMWVAGVCVIYHAGVCVCVCETGVCMVCR